MLRKIQNYLLLNHPLIWNIKFVPLLITAVIINILFFISGYAYGEIDFTAIRDEYYYRREGSPVLVTFLSIILSLIIITIWIVYYIRNNAFKSFYPKNSLSLFKEWVLIFILCIINCSYFISFMYATEVRARHYYSRTELMERSDIITKASFFSDGGYERSRDTIINRNDAERETFKYCGKEYNLKSLLNKIPLTFSLQEHSRDSLTTRRVRRWLVDNKKDSVFTALKQFIDLAEKDHGLKANITSQEWLDLIYDYTDFTNYKVVGNNSYEAVYRYDQYANKPDYDRDYDEYPENNDNQPIDFTINVKKIVKGKIEIFPKYYVPMDQLKTSYNIMNKAWHNPEANMAVLGGLVYFALGLSLLLFSFRVTSGRNWLIAGVSGGILVFITALGSIIISELYEGALYRTLLIRDEYLFLTMWVAIVFILIVYYLIALRKKSKGILGIVINVLLWLLPAVIPVIYIITNKVTRNMDKYKFINGESIAFNNPVYTWTEQNFGNMLIVNIVLVVVYMYFFTISIKKWKGIAEG